MDALQRLFTKVVKYYGKVRGPFHPIDASSPTNKNKFTTLIEKEKGNRSTRNIKQVIAFRQHLQSGISLEHDQEKCSVKWLLPVHIPFPASRGRGHQFS